MPNNTTFVILAVADILITLEEPQEGHFTMVLSSMYIGFPSGDKKVISSVLTHSFLNYSLS